MSFILQCFKMRYDHQKKEKKKKVWEGLSTAQQELRPQINGLNFISTASRAHPTLPLLVFPQRGPHSQLSTLLRSLFLVLIAFSIQSLAQLSQSIYFRVMLAYCPVKIILYTSNLTPSISHSTPLLSTPPTQHPLLSQIMNYF